MRCSFLVALSLVLVLPSLHPLSHPHAQIFKPVHPTQIRAMLSLKAAWGGRFEGADTWLPTSPCNEWVGITCQVNGTVIQLELSSTGIVGPLPGPPLANLTTLNFVDLSGNSLQGLIPGPAIGKLRNLQSLFLGGNRLTGGIPWQLGQLKGLEVLDLTGNRLAGPIPASLLSGATRLQELLLGSNLLSGQIPGTVTNLVRLRAVDLSNNRLVGGFPPRFGEKLRNLSRLILANNAFTGTLMRLPPMRFSSVLSLLDLRGNYFYGYPRVRVALPPPPRPPRPPPSPSPPPPRRLSGRTTLISGTNREEHVDGIQSKVSSPSSSSSSSSSSGYITLCATDIVASVISSSALPSQILLSNNCFSPSRHCRIQGSSLAPQRTALACWRFCRTTTANNTATVAGPGKPPQQCGGHGVCVRSTPNGQSRCLCDAGYTSNGVPGRKSCRRR